MKMLCSVKNEQTRIEELEYIIANAENIDPKASGNLCVCR
jgi:hypothetical protein